MKNNKRFIYIVENQNLIFCLFCKFFFVVGGLLFFLWSQRNPVSSLAKVDCQWLKRVLRLLKRNKLMDLFSLALLRAQFCGYVLLPPSSVAKRDLKQSTGVQMQRIERSVFLVHFNDIDVRFGAWLFNGIVESWCHTSKEGIVSLTEPHSVEYCVRRLNREKRIQIEDEMVEWSGLNKGNASCKREREKERAV